MDNALIINPIIWADIPDPDIIRVGHHYYMVSTSMHVMPGCPIMKSQDLLNWEIVNYVYDSFENNDAHNMVDGKNIYGQGSWAASLREHNGLFYVCFSSNDMHQFYMYTTDDIENGNWQRSVINGLLHDPSLLFDEDRVFVIYGNGGIYIAELTADATAVKEGGIVQLLLETESEGIGLRCEGCHAYRIDGMYYLFFIEWPTVGNKRRRQVCYRSSELLGPYERKIILDDDMGYHNKGIAQGGIIETEDHKWYTLLFQDHDAVGRIPVVQPIEWIDGWPIVGIDGKASEKFATYFPYTPSKPIVISDDFDYEENKLALNWQWNHNPNNNLWSVTDRYSHLRLTTGNLVDSVLKARNTLTQRTEGPACIATSVMDISNMKHGDHAGLIALQNLFGTVGIKVDSNDDRVVVMSMNDGHGMEAVVESVPYNHSIIYFKIEFNFANSIDIAKFYYASEEGQWLEIGRPLEMKYTLDHFMGYRIGIFNYASQKTGGYVDVDYLHFMKLINGTYQLMK